MTLALSSARPTPKIVWPGERQSIVLSDGRTLGFAEYGAADGLPVFGFHGTPGSRIMFRLIHEPALRIGLRIIAPDRPGFGHSTFQANRSLAEWPGDVAALAGKLGLAHFGVAGISGGGPYAAACAALLPDRVAVAALISPMGPVCAPEGPDSVGSAQHRMFRLFPFLTPAMRGAFSVGRLMFMNAPDSMYRLIMARAAPIDRPTLMRQEIRENLLDGVAEGFALGIQGMIEEVKIFGRPWNLAFEDVRAPVLLWQGTADRNVPVASALRLAELIPGCKLFRIEGAGHYWVFDHVDEVLSQIAVELKAGKGTSGLEPNRN